MLNNTEVENELDNDFIYKRFGQAYQDYYIHKVDKMESEENLNS